jgi:GAF domain-containing protein
MASIGPTDGSAATSAPAGYGAALAKAVRSIHQDRSAADILAGIADAARSSVPGFDHAGISIVKRNGDIETKAATDELVNELDRIQYRLQEGPCVSAMRTEPLVSVPDIRHEQRWPSYVPLAVDLGLRSQLAVRLYVDDEKGTIGGLNLYSTSAAQIDKDAASIADLFAAHAAIALDQVREVSQLTEALSSRKIIGQATGILMERYELDEDRAFAFLVRASSHGNIKLRDVAAELVAEAERRRTDGRG